jgi:hypothetical protein
MWKGMPRTLEVIELRRILRSWCEQGSRIKIIGGSALKINQSAEGSFFRAVSAKLAGTNDSFKNVEK